MALIKIKDPNKKMLKAIKGVQEDAGIKTQSGAVKFILEKWEYVNKQEMESSERATELGQSLAFLVHHIKTIQHSKEAIQERIDWLEANNII